MEWALMTVLEMHGNRKCHSRADRTGKGLGTIDVYEQHRQCVQSQKLRLLSLLALFPWPSPHCLSHVILLQLKRLKH